MFRAIASLMLFGTLSPLGVFASFRAPTPIPFVAAPAAVSAFVTTSAFSASGAIVMDATNGTVLFARNADLKRSMGSLAKLMTTIIILENHDMNEVVTIPRSASQIQGMVARLQPGEKYTIKDLLTAMLIGSSNDAAHTLAMYHSGSRDAFAEAMNTKSKTLGLTNTQFRNPMGFDNVEQYATPRDLAWLAMYALKHEFISDLTSTRSATIRDQSGEHMITLYNTNQLLTTHPSEFFGLKTGTTLDAGECLISLAFLHGRPYIFVVMHSADRYKDTLELFDSLLQKHV